MKANVELNKEKYTFNTQQLHVYKNKKKSKADDCVENICKTFKGEINILY